METYGLDFCYIALLKYIEMRRFMAEKEGMYSNNKVDAIIMDSVNREALDYAAKRLKTKILTDTDLMMYLSAIRPQMSGFTDLLFQMDNISLLNYDKFDKEQKIEPLYKKAKKIVDKKKSKQKGMIAAEYYKQLFITFRDLASQANSEEVTESKTDFLWLKYLLIFAVLLVFCFVLRFLR